MNPPDIVLTHGYFLKEDPKELQIMKPYAPLGMLYLCSHLQAKGFRVEVFDSTFADRSQLYDRLRTGRPSTLGIYANLMTRANVVEILGVARLAGWTTIVGGPEPSSYMPEFLDAGAQFVVMGEAETTVESLLAAINVGASPGRLAQIPGIAYLDETGRMRRTAPRQHLLDLDKQPWPARKEINLPQYVQTWRENHGQGSLHFITARGCPYRCRWCSHQVYGQTHRRRDPVLVVDELEWLLKEYNPDMVWVSDDVFTIHHDWMRRYAAEMKRRGIRIPFECISRADRLNEEMLDLLAELNCFRVWIGSESGSQRILDAMDRGVTVEQIQRTVQLTRERGIQSGIFLMWGYEGEQTDDIEATIRHVRTTRPDSFLTTICYPVHSTPFRDAVQDRIVQLKPWAETSDRELKIRGRHSRRYYAFADKLLRDEVQIARLREMPDADPGALAALQASIQTARSGLHASAAEVEA